MTTTTQGRARGMFMWALTHVGLFIGLLAQIVGVGAVLAIVQRRFRWRAFFQGGAVFALVALATVITARTAFAMSPDRDTIVWTGVLCAAAFAGFVAARKTDGIAFWETYVIIVVGAAVGFVHLALGWHIVLGIEPATFAETSIFTPPGVQWFGALWDRIFALMMVASFLVGVFGGSLAFLFSSGSGARHAGGSTLERFISRRHLSGQGHDASMSLTAGVAVAGIALGVAALIAVTSVMSGYQEDIQDKILSTNAHLVVQKYGIDFVEYEEVIAKLRKNFPNDIVAATPFVFNEAMLSTGNRALGVLIKGLVPTEAGQVTAIEQNLCQRVTAHGCERAPGHDAAPAITLAQIFAAQNHAPEGPTEDIAPEAVPTALIGLQLFRRLELPIGSTISLTTPVGIGGGSAPRRMTFRIGGVFSSGMHEFDAKLIYLDLPNAQRLMGLGSAVNGIELRMAHPEQVEAKAKQILSKLGRYPYRTMDWRELNMGIFTALKLQKVVMFLVLTFIIIVAAFNIASTLFMAVVEKAREIAILKSMGTSDASIMKIFVLQGWMTGAAGTLLGVVLGLSIAFGLSKLHIAIAADVYWVESLRVKIQASEVMFTVVCALLISHLATLYPSLKAARQRPVEALRHE